MKKIIILAILAIIIYKSPSLRYKAKAVGRNAVTFVEDTLAVIGVPVGSIKSSLASGSSPATKTGSYSRAALEPEVENPDEPTFDFE